MSLVFQIASRELEIPVSEVHVCETSTDSVPNTLVSGGSLGTDVNGMAVKVHIFIDNLQ